MNKNKQLNMERDTNSSVFDFFSNNNNNSHKADFFFVKSRQHTGELDDVWREFNHR